MIDQQIIDDVVYGQKQPQNLIQILSSIKNQSQLANILRECIDSFCKKQKLNLRDYNTFAAIINKSTEVNGVFTSKNTIYDYYKYANRIGLWIGLFLSSTAQNADKHRSCWQKNINKKGQFWGFTSLQRFEKYLQTKDKQYFEKYNRLDYDREIANIQYCLNFISHNLKLFPSGFDFKQIIIRYICMIRLQTTFQKNLIQQLIQFLLTTSKQSNFTMLFRYCFQFYRYEIDQKQSPFHPHKSIFQLVQKLPQLVLSQMMTNAMIGLQWSNQNYVVSLKNCLKMGLTLNMTVIMSRIKQSAVKNNRIQSLLSFIQNQLIKGFVYLKFPVHFESSIEIIKQFVLGGPYNTKIFQKCLTKIKNLQTGIQKQNKHKFNQFLYLLKMKYQNHTSVQILDQIIEKSGYSNPSIPYLQQQLQKYDWMLSETSFQPANPLQSELQILAKSLTKKISATSINKQYKGLSNIGNSCYMNSFLQALYMTKQFRNKILTIDFITKEKQISSIEKYQKRVKQVLAPLVELQKLFALLYRSKRPYVNPIFMKSVISPIFRGNSQQDTGQFGRMFLQSIQQLYENIYEGKHEIIIECGQCHVQRKKEQKFMDLIVPLSDESSEQKKQIQLEQLIKKMEEPQSIQNLTCDECKIIIKKSLKRVHLVGIPHYLIITLGRFSYDMNLKKKKKLHQKVHFQQQITIKQKIYYLNSIIVHRGISTQCGHYYTFSRLDPNSPTWICFDDSIVTLMQNFQSVNNFLQSSPDDTPYLFFLAEKQHLDKIRNEGVYNQAIILSQKLLGIIQKEDLQFLKQSKSNNRYKFQLPKVNLPFFKKDDQDEDHPPSSNNNHLIM